MEFLVLGGQQNICQRVQRLRYEQQKVLQVYMPVNKVLMFYMAFKRQVFCKRSVSVANTCEHSQWVLNHLDSAAADFPATISADSSLAPTDVPENRKSPASAKKIMLFPSDSSKELRAKCMGFCLLLTQQPCEADWAKRQWLGQGHPDNFLFKWRPTPNLSSVSMTISFSSKWLR